MTYVNWTHVVGGCWGEALQDPNVKWRNNALNNDERPRTWGDEFHIFGNHSQPWAHGNRLSKESDSIWALAAPNHRRLNQGPPFSTITIIGGDGTRQSQGSCFTLFSAFIMSYKLAPSLVDRNESDINLLISLSTRYSRDVSLPKSQTIPSSYFPAIYVASVCRWGFTICLSVHIFLHFLKMFCWMLPIYGRVKT